MSMDYDNGYRQFAAMVGPENMKTLAARFRAVCPDFEQEVISVVGGRIWNRGGIDLKTRSLCSICVLAALGRHNALKLNYTMAKEASAIDNDLAEALVQFVW